MARADNRNTERKEVDGSLPPTPHAAGRHQFEQLVYEHAPLLIRFARRLTGDVHEADDLVQETFLRAHRALGTFQLREYGTKPWLLKILNHAFFSRRVRARREPTLLEDVDFESVATELEAAPLPQLAAGQLDWDGFDEELKHAVAQIPVEYRSVLLLWALGDLAYREIADVLGVAVGTVMSRLYRARQMLGKALADYADRKGIRTESAD